MLQLHLSLFYVISGSEANVMTSENTAASFTSLPVVYLRSAFGALGLFRTINGRVPLTSS